MNLNTLTLAEAKAGLATKKFTSLELTQACFDQIKEVEPALNAFVTVSEKEALKQAESADINLPLGGIPLAVKDNFLTSGIRTTASSKVLDNYIAQYDATVIEKLKSAGAIIIGKTNMDAWAHGSSTETSDYGSTKNPWHTNRLPGGSSGGSAAAVAANETIISIGSETAGSIRQPASWCGVVGFKPTYGRVSRYGVIAMKSSTDSPGPICKTVDDAATLLEIMSGHDSRDATSINESSWVRPTKLTSLNGKKIGLPLSYFSQDMQSEVRESIMQSVEILKKLGAEIIELPDVLDPKYSIAVYTILQRSEVSSNLGRFDGVRYGNDRTFFGTEAKRRIMLGTYSLSSGYYDSYYLKAQKVRTLICQDFDKQFSKVDAIVGPVSPTTALPLGATDGQSMFGELQDMLVEPSSIAGLPGISIPCGFDKNNLPIGLQIMAPQKREDTIYQIAEIFESNSDFHTKKPNL
ncbi:Asp-tRNA(Asn)/Glu-tRNA(Gln) amidotransferase subunit GatA [Candidatus Shapirobacteria bacterium]|nr:Asp-tRNA(Asn)/Glu-tRNA(Gln) amidotransferase subunit GatA [Candidatus Shapirobacteria bacterium]